MKILSLWYICLFVGLVSLTWCSTQSTTDTPSVQSQDPAPKDRSISHPGYDVYDAWETTKAEFEWRNYVLFFYTPDCADCLSLDLDIINNLENMPDELTIYKVDMTEYTDLVDVYSVRWPNTVTIVNDKNNFSSIQWITTLSALVGSMWTTTISIK